MTIGEALEAGRRRLGRSGSPYLDALLLLSMTLGVKKEVLLADLGEACPAEAFDRYFENIAIRANGYPAAYILKRKEFYGLDFHVDERVLVPRPETEILVETALGVVGRCAAPPALLDLCTGSGCVAVVLALHSPAHVSAADISEEAAEVFAVNVSKHAVAIPFYRSDLLRNVPGRFDIIVSNPPYLTSKEAKAEDLRFEPREALDGGPDGTRILADIIAGSRTRLFPGGRLIIEAAPWQFERLMSIFTENRYTEIEVARDLAGRERVISGRFDNGTDRTTP